MDAARLTDEARALVRSLRTELRSAVAFEWEKTPRVLRVLRKAQERLERRHAFELAQIRLRRVEGLKELQHIRKQEVN